MRLPIVIGEQIRTHRLRAHLTVDQAAAQAEISNRFLEEIERGTAVVSLQTVEKIADIVVWDICTLIGGGK